MDVQDDGLEMSAPGEICRRLLIKMQVQTAKGWEDVELEADEAEVDISDGWFSFRPTSVSSMLVDLEKLVDYKLRGGGE